MKLDNEHLSEIEQAYCDNDVRALCECARDKQYYQHCRKTIKNCIIMFIGSLIFWGIFYILVFLIYLR